jgi:hypothetical protein
MAPGERRLALYPILVAAWLLDGWIAAAGACSELSGTQSFIKDSFTGRYDNVPQNWDTFNIARRFVLAGEDISRRQSVSLEYGPYI